MAAETIFKLGIDTGSSTEHVVLMKDHQIIGKWERVHHGRPAQSLKEILAEIGKENFAGEKIAVSITGSSRIQILLMIPELKAMEDIPAIIEGTRYMVPEAESIIEIGSQGSRFITDFREKAPAFSVNEHCAGGTGSFFEDQMSRLGMTIEDYSKVCSQAKNVPRLSGRCAVFAKTDIIHRQQEGVPVPDILMGLCYAMVRNYKATIVRTLPVKKPVVFCGGVTKNTGVEKAIREVFDLKDGELILPDDACFAGAIGAAEKAEGCFALEDLERKLSAHLNVEERDSAEPLTLPEDICLLDPAKTEVLPADGDIYLGIDIGSTSTDLVMTGNAGELIDFWYLRTAGNPEAAVRTGLAAIRKKYGEITFRSVGVTGSGRDRMGKMIGADVIRDEITAQAKGACWWVPEADTVFEIGGQDSKFISLKKGEVVDFQMNKICAAGTGSFVEEQAARMEIPITEFGKMAMVAKHPASLGERCTVFIETAISGAAADGVPTEDIAAGLCLSIVRNYLHKVVGNKRIGEHIVLQGGVAYNPGIVAAFRSFYGDRIQVNPCFSISGAFGVAMLAKQAADRKPEETASSFKGFDFAVTAILPEKHSPEVQRNINFYKKAGELLLDGYDGKIDPKKKTVGVPYVLMIHKFFPMANAFFKDLGYNVLLTKPTNEDTIFLSQKLAQSETCYPVKLIYGHMQQLIDAGVDYIFLPTIHSMKHEKSHVAHNYGCVYMQSAPVSVAKALKLEEKGITLLSPVFDLDFGQQAMAGSMVGLGKLLGKPAPFCAKALMSGSMAVRKHTAAVEQLGKQILDNIRPEDKVLVLITRNYGVGDPILNMGIPELLLERGYKVLTLSHLPAHNLDISGDYPNLYWPFGQHIISGAKIIAAHPNLYAVYLTNHGCGPDSMLSHLFRQEMGDKPYLQIEVDEHFSKVGVITRIEAFLNSITNRENTVGTLQNLTDIASNPDTIHLTPDKGLPLMLPDFGVYTPYLQEYLSTCGYDVRRLPDFSEKHLALGRSETSAKEYLPFPALLGQVMANVQKTEEKNDAVQYLIPNTRGSEADGQYAQAIHATFQAAGKPVNIAGVILEKMPETEHFDLFCRALVTGDLKNLDQKIVSEKNSDWKDRVAADYHTGGMTGRYDHILSWEEAHQLAAEIGKQPLSGRTLFAVGDPYMVTVLNDDVLATLQREGENVLTMSLLECYLMLWMDQDEAPSNKRKLDAISGQIRALHQELGQHSVFSKDPASLPQWADRYLAKFDGGNGRYRYVKCLEMGDRCSAILHISPRYENTGVILEQRELSANCKAPVFNMQMDGDWDESAWNRLRSFLYYCRK